MADVGDLIGNIDGLRLQRGRDEALDEAVFAIRLVQPFAHFPGQIKAIELRILQLQFLHDPQALVVVAKPAMLGHAAIERLLAQMTEGWMAEIVRQGDGFRQVLVEAKRARHGACDAGDLDGVGHPGAVMVAGGIEKDLGLVLQAPEGAAVDNAVAIPLERGAESVLILGMGAAPRLHAVLSPGRMMARLTLLQVITAARHPTKMSPNRAGFN